MIFGDLRSHGIVNVDTVSISEGKAQDKDIR
jgi:hypothetical protein